MLLVLKIAGGVVIGLLACALIAALLQPVGEWCREEAARRQKKRIDRAMQVLGQGMEEIVRGMPQHQQPQFVDTPALPRKPLITGIATDCHGEPAARDLDKRKASTKEFAKAITEMEEMQRFVNDPERMKPWKAVQFKCEFAEGRYWRDMTSVVPEIRDQAAPQREKSIQACLADTRRVDDEFCKGAMLHAIAKLMCHTEQLERGRNLIGSIAVDVIRENASEELLSETAAFPPDTSQPQQPPSPDTPSPHSPSQTEHLVERLRFGWCGDQDIMRIMGWPCSPGSFRHSLEPIAKNHGFVLKVRGSVGLSSECEYRFVRPNA
jgi:hypothetical protein